MEIFKWLRKNLSNIVWLSVMLLLLFSTTAKEYLIRAVSSTGITTASFEKSAINEKEINSFSVVDSQKNRINIRELEGKVVFINFWASWCPPCRAEFPSIQTFYNEYRSEKDVVFILINMDDDLQKGLDFLNEKKYDIPTYQLASTISTEIYNGTLPTTVVLDKKGNIRFHHTGAGNFSTKKFKKNIDQLLRE